MSNEMVLNELKNKGLPTFGTAAEKKERLKRFHGIQGGQITSFEEKYEAQPKGVKKSGVVGRIEEMKQKREERRKKMEDDKRQKLEREAENLAVGKCVDVDFEIMIEHFRENAKQMRPHLSPENLKINVCIRKRPLFKKEAQGGELDCVSVANPKVLVHECKYKVDGITKYLDNTEFEFDNTFSEAESSESLYKYSIKSLIPLLFNKGVVTCFAYGQTGSGKTYTMRGAQEFAIRDLFHLGKKTNPSLKYTISFFEIYEGRLFDLLNNREKLVLLEDANQKIQVQGLTEQAVDNPSKMLEIIEFGHKVRTTHATTANDTSSRSHAICQITIRAANNSFLGKFLLVDLAGSERAQDCQSNNRQRRLEGAEINKSLLSLKECIRALDARGPHVPFRASKLTMVLRDSFIGSKKQIRIVMIACVSPGKNSADHTLNTLRYAERLKDKSSLGYTQMAKLQQDLGEAEEEVDDEDEEVAVVPHKEEPAKKKPEAKKPTKKAVKEEVKDDWQYLKETLHVRNGGAVK
jgi:kinesin family protein 2/24